MTSSKAAGGAGAGVCCDCSNSQMMDPTTSELLSASIGTASSVISELLSAAAAGAASAIGACVVSVSTTSSGALSCSEATGGVKTGCDTGGGGAPQADSTNSPTASKGVIGDLSRRACAMDKRDGIFIKIIIPKAAKLLT